MVVLMSRIFSGFLLQLVILLFVRCASLFLIMALLSFTSLWIMLWFINMKYGFLCYVIILHTLLISILNPTGKGRLIQMIKRYFSIFLAGVFVFISAFALFPTSVSAAEDDNGLKCIDILSYDYPDDFTSALGRMNTSRPYHVFDLPFSYGLVYFDIIFDCAAPISSAGMRSTASGTFYSLTLASLGSNRYRCYGQTSSAFNSAQFAFQINSSDPSWTVTYYKFNAYTVTDIGIGDLGELKLTPDADSPFDGPWRRQTSSGSRLYQQFYYYSQAENYNQFTALFSSVNWRKYDYLDFSLEFDVANITSISAYILLSDGTRRYLSFDISYFDSGVIDKNEYIKSGGSYAVPSYSFYDILMRIYIPSSYRVSGSLYIEVNGKYHAAASSACINSVLGYYYTSVPSPDLVKLDQITQAIKDSLSSSESQNAAADQFSSSINSASQGVSSNLAELGSLEKPSLDDFNSMIDPSSLIDGNGISLLVTTFLPITGSNMVLSIMVLSCTLGIISFCIFGKKG